jgi:hypothetical protein
MLNTTVSLLESTIGHQVATIREIIWNNRKKELTIMMTYSEHMTYLLKLAKY